MGVIPNSVAKSAAEITVMGWPQMLGLLSQSVFIGLILMTITFLTCQAQAGPEDQPQEALNESANVLLICFGMTSVMLLVSNNLARAFTIGAAIALVRFRVKVDNKGLAMALFYGVLSGMACGVDQSRLAWLIAAVYALLQIVIHGFRKFMPKPKCDPAPTPAPIALTENAP